MYSDDHRCLDCKDDTLHLRYPVQSNQHFQIVNQRVLKYHVHWHIWCRNVRHYLDYRDDTFPYLPAPFLVHRIKKVK